MRRVAIIGNAGSGKSTLARRIAAECGATVLDLDTVAWEPGKPAAPRASAAAVREVRAFCSAHAAWVIEGCYGDLVEAVLDGAVELVFLNLSEADCVRQCRGRAWEPHKWKTKEAQDAHLDCLLDWVRAYYRRDGALSLAGHRAIFDRYAGPKREITQPAALPDLTAREA
ncbi:AAA family ATPase [Oleiharenicola sp. Vm1]|uniref:AAA family ATPase n=1 Tax=Oleiharenicola sp. Vm1 TaxID=3398393 RepID=UPI0039F4B70C